jgi:hypothetical protein
LIESHLEQRWTVIGVIRARCASGAKRQSRRNRNQYPLPSASGSHRSILNKSALKGKAFLRVDRYIVKRSWIVPVKAFTR